MPARATVKAPANGSAVESPAGFRPLRLTPRAEPAERVPLFYIGDVEYTIPAHPDAGIALTYMEILAEDGAGPKAEARANVYIFREMLGEDGYRALKDFGGLSMAELGELMIILSRHVMGALEVPKGLPGSA